MTEHRMLNVTNIEKGHSQMTSSGKYKYYAKVVMDRINARPEDIDDEFRDAVIRHEVIPITRQYFETRFTNTLKQFNNVPERAFDLYMTKKNMEFFNQFIEETYLLVAKHIHHKNIVPLQLMIGEKDQLKDLFYIVRKELRHMAHELHHELNKHAENIDDET